MKRECKTCEYAKYIEEKFVVGYVCTLCGKDIDAVFPNDEKNGFIEEKMYDISLNEHERFQKRKGYKYWCPLIKHKK